MEMYGRSKWNFYTVRIAISYVTMATMETESLLEVQIAVDAAVKELETWSAVIAFTVIKPYCLEPENCDNIIQYLDPMWLGCKVYFPVSKYTVDILDKNSPGWELLKKDLGIAAFDNGTCIVSNGGGQSLRRFQCKASFLYKDSKDPTLPPTYRVSDLHADRKNTRGREGLTMPCRTGTCRALLSDAKCGMYFIVM